MYIYMYMWYVMSCICDMAFQCGSTLIKAPLLQAGTVAILRQMLKTMLNPYKQMLKYSFRLSINMNYLHFKIR